MRRTDRERTDPEFFENVLTRAEEIHVAFAGDDKPYVIPMNFAGSSKALYMHCAGEGHKLDLMQRDGRVGFSLCCDVQIDPAKASTYYSSLCGNGKMVVVTDAEEKMRGLTLIAQKYGAHCAPASPAKTMGVTVLRLDIEDLHGKCCTERQEGECPACS